MNASCSKSFDQTLQLTYVWLHELAEELGGTEDRARAYHALRGILHAIRDRLTVAEVADLGSQLPLLVRGIYYEGWHPGDKPLRGHRRDAFLAAIASEFPEDEAVDPERVAAAGLRVLRRHLTEGLVQMVEPVLPADLATLSG